MASASTHTTQTSLGRTSIPKPFGTQVVTDLLHCMVVSWSEQRARLLRSVAADESWQAKVCDDVQEFLRSIFQLDVPLTIVDLPDRENATYTELREIAARACGIKRSLMIVCGAAKDDEEELWARQIGAWAYLPEAADRSGLRLVFAEARKALAKQSTTYVEASGYR